MLGAGAGGINVPVQGSAWVCQRFFQSVHLFRMRVEVRRGKENHGLMPGGFGWAFVTSNARRRNSALHRKPKGAPRTPLMERETATPPGAVLLI